MGKHCHNIITQPIFLFCQGLATREEMFITGKLWGTEHAKDRVEAHCRLFILQNRKMSVRPAEADDFGNL